jgi:peptidyl-prolyl cis-trans isomerase D
MLQNFREHTQGWVATVLGSILALAFLLWGIENYLNANPKKNLVAKVNGEEITSAQLNADYQRMLLRLKEYAGSNLNLPSAMQQQMKRQALNNLATQTVLVQAANKAGFMITPYHTSAVIKQMPEFQQDGQFSKARFQQIISRLDYTQPQFIADIQQTLLLNQVASGIAGTEFVLPNELGQTMAIMEQKRDVAYVVLTASQFKKEVKSEDVKLYYEQHANKFMAPAKLRLEYVELSLAALKKNSTVSQQELADYFGSNGDLVKSDPKVIAKAKETLLQQKAEQEFSANSDKLTELSYTNPASLQETADALGLKVMTTD